MAIKKKLTVSGIAGAMGLSLIAGGTWAAFNDVDATTGSVEAGTLKMDLSEDEGPYTFDITDLKPGDHMTRYIQFDNNGSLAIKDVLMTIEDVEFTDYVPEQGDAGYGDTWTEDTDYSVLDYLDQFKVEFLQVGREGDNNNYPKDVFLNVSLKDLYLASDSLGNQVGTQSEIDDARLTLANAVDGDRLVDNRLKVSTTANEGWEGIPVDPSDEDQMGVKVRFVKDDETYNDGTYKQNKFQGDSADITLSFEARQWDGQEYNGDGNIDENGRTDTNRDGSKTE
ncbi:TasA family protein [Alkalibacillus salilacus]|uniref:Spore coat-associated protein N n=1 Tax=Alkalibacillus salilacus TaxID=284582 RepID=A0ABT9VAX0_9BACI|nr:TasA family protein [Alkalibacillus salilacus]MDQ0158072.1 spore coat-associated protein N [Alkalibacillus salilacus]